MALLAKIIDDWSWKYISAKTCPVEKELVHWFRRDWHYLRSGESWFPGGAITGEGEQVKNPTSPVLEVLLDIQAFLFEFYSKLEKDKGNQNHKCPPQKFSGIFSYQTKLWRGAYKSFEKVSNFWFKEMKSDLERLIAARDKKTGNWILKKSQDKEWTKILHFCWIKLGVYM